MSQVLVFQSTQFDAIDRNGNPWLRLPQIEGALGYTKRGAVQTLYDRHADEFTDSMTAVVTLPTAGGPQETRIFSLRGCHLLAMFARTAIAKEFRVWVLDVLEKLNRPQPLPLPPTTITPEQQCTLQNMVKALVDKGGIYANIWSRFNNHFRIAKYNQLPQSHMGKAIKYLMAFDTEPRNELPSDPGALLEPHFLKIRILASEINTHEQAIYEIIRQHRGNTFKKLDAKRSAMVNMHGTMDNLFYTINYAVDAAENHAKAMCMMSNL